MADTIPTPTGAVTLWLTDIEGSTQLWERYPEAMGRALARHDQVIAEVVARHGGVVVKSRGEGDSVFGVFQRAVDAVAASIATQQALLAEPWPDDLTLKVRLALHTGEVELRDGDYFGAAVNRAARLRSIGHGGQILLSQATALLTQDHLPADSQLRDLGEHRLRDLSRSERVFQLEALGLPTTFQPLRSLSAASKNLPTPVTSFIGRSWEVSMVKSMLTRTRLMTLTGAGGSGKTRLALQVAAEQFEACPDGVWLIELASLADPALVPRAVASVLGVQEETGRSLTLKIAEAIRHRRLLLVIDNCEHLIAACAQLVDTQLSQSVEPRFLVTSREALGIAGEHTLRTPPLSLIDPGSLVEPGRDPVVALNGSDAARLFIERAQAAQPHFHPTTANASVIAHLCRRLDGTPLAIELAAARVKALSVEQIEARLDQRFRLLTDGSRTALPRQQTLAATIEWSYQLLTAEEQILLRRLSVFAGGWTLAAAEVVAAGEDVEAWDVLDGLTRLIDKSLVVTDESGDAVRYRLLESIRQYARDRLAETPEVDASRDRHLRYFLDLAEPAFTWWEPGGYQQRFRLAPEIDNLRAALEWGLTIADTEPAARLVGALGIFWWWRGDWTEGRNWAKQARSRAATGVVSDQSMAGVLLTDGLLAWHQGAHEETKTLLAEAVRLFREGPSSAALVMALMYQGGNFRSMGKFATAMQKYDEGLTLARALGSNPLTAMVLWHIGVTKSLQKDFAAAEPILNECLRLGVDVPFVAINARTSLGRIAYRLKNYQAACRWYEESNALARRDGEHMGLAESLHGLGYARLALGQFQAARDALEESLRRVLVVGDTLRVQSIQRGLAEALRHTGNLADAAERIAGCFGNLAEIRPFTSGSVVERNWRQQLAENLRVAAKIGVHTGDYLAAGRLLGAADSVDADDAWLLGLLRLPPLTLETMGQGQDRETVAAGYAEGQTMTTEAAIAEAHRVLAVCRQRVEAAGSSQLASGVEIAGSVMA